MSARSDHEVALRMQIAELLASYDEVDEAAYTAFTERFGADANENLATWCVDVRATAEEMLLLCATDFPRYRAIAATGGRTTDGDVEPSHGDRVADSVLDHPGTVAGRPYWSDEHGGVVVGVVWDDDPETVDRVALDRVVADGEPFTAE